MLISVGEKSGTVQKFMDRHGYSFLNVLDTDKLISSQYGIRSHPVKFLINKEGQLIGKSQGYRKWDSDEIKSLISALIQQ